MSGLVAAGLRSDADAAWFVSPHGFLRHCIEIAAGRTRPCDTDTLEQLLAELDDRIVAVRGSTAAARGRALHAVATARSGDERDAAIGELARSISGENELGEMTRRAAAECAALIHGAAPSAPLHTSSIPFAVTNHVAGGIFRLELSASDGNDLAPDLREAPFQRYDASFLDAVVTSRRATGVQGSHRFVVTSIKTGIPVDAVVGRSVSLAAAIGMARTGKEPRPAPDPTWVFTGDLGADGAVRPLAEAGRPRGYIRKAEAVANRTLVLPAADLPVVEEILAEHVVTPLPVTTLAEAEDAIARHQRGTAAYADALTSRRRPKWLVALAAAVAVIALLAGWRAFGDGETRSAAQRAAAAANPLKKVADPGGSLKRPAYLSTTEVTVGIYDLCLEKGTCTRSRKLTVDTSKLTDDGPKAPQDPNELPVVGVSPAEAQTFCRWAYGPQATLPSFEAMRAAVAASSFGFPAGSDSYDYVPAGKGEATNGVPRQPLAVGDQSVDGNEFPFISGNVAEWTTHWCTDLECGDIDGDIQEGSNVAFRTFGISYQRARASQTGEWLTNKDLIDQILAAEGYEDVGIRCASPTLS